MKKIKIMFEFNEDLLWYENYDESIGESYTYVSIV